jgi:hypothetical protein
MIVFYFFLPQAQYNEHFIPYPTRAECDLQYSKSTEVYKISRENQFFLFRIRLRRAADVQELVSLVQSTFIILFYFLGSFFKNLSQPTVIRLIIAWTRFVYSVVSSVSLGQSKEQVKNNLPFEMKKNYPTVRVIVDCTEFEIEQPKNPQAQQNTWSTYKNTNTAKGKQLHTFY